MKRKLLRIGVAIVIFFISLFVSNMILNRGNTDMTVEMAPASLPIVYMNVNDEYINPLHGYTVEMEGNYLRGSITPLNADRSVSFRADLYDAVIAKVGYEVRPLDMSRLIEDTEVSDFTFEDNLIYATANLKDLINDDEEYMLIIKLTTSSGNVIRYYTRVINRAELSINEKIDFIRDFSGKTMNEQASEELRQYMESNSEGDNSSYAYVNIHSSFNQLTWGDLAPSLKTKKDLEILEIDESGACVRLTYQVEILSEIHNVTEYFRVQKGSDRMYLMEYERTMNQVFDEEKNVVVNGKILHGIINEDIKRIENDNGTIYCFVQQNGLYAYNITNNTMARLFAFNDKENDDERTRYNAHSIKPLSVDGVGNVKFIVYGYMNRGRHEGQAGVALYSYDAALNTIEEMLFIPYTKSFQILEKDIERFAYVTARDQLYLLIDGSVYSINIENLDVQLMQDSISETSFYAADDESMIAWQMGETASDYDQIQLFKMDNRNTSNIVAPAGDIVVPLGFMDSDLIYGIGHKSDITTDETGRTLIPMYSVNIQSENGTLLKEYSQPGVYILSVEKQDNMLVLTRVTIDEETGGFTSIEDDQIMNNKTETLMKNDLTSVVTEETETTYQTKLYRDTLTTSLKITNPKEIAYEGSRSIELSNEDNLTRYYVYSKGELNDIYTDASTAINEAEEDYGVVVNKQLAYIFETGNRKSSARLYDLDINLENIKSEKDLVAQSSIAEVSESSGNEVGIEEEEGNDSTSQTMSAYAKCLDIMLKSQGVYKDTEKELQGYSIIRVLRDSMPEMNTLELTGCDLSAVLYYVSSGYPVMAMTGNGQAVLIVGYDSKNTLLYDPVNDFVYRKGLNDSATWFEQNGNRFISYVK